MPPKTAQDSARDAGADVGVQQPTDTVARPSQDEAKLLQEKVQNATKPPLEVNEEFMSDAAMKALGLTDEKIADAGYYVVKSPFMLNWDNHHRIQFRQGGPFKDSEDRC